MSTRGRTKATLIEAASRLFRSRGYHGVGVNAVIAEAGAPAGSLYFHFPGGKQQLAAAAVRLAGERISAAIRTAATEDPRIALHEYFRGLGAELQRSGWESGCPIATVTLDVASDSPEVQASCADAYGTWRDALADGLRKAGVDDRLAEERAITLLAATQGALILARAWQTTEPLEVVASQLEGLVPAGG
jgi:TetR/AcrR family transcriptional repressor of lmrAB and yxaGH operons